jgi:hypothetical protein
MDGRTTANGAFVVIQLVTDQREVDIISLLSSNELRSDPRNHCVPILDIIPVPEDPDTTLIVKPLTQDFWRPPLETVDEFVEFLDQVLEVRVKDMRTPQNPGLHLWQGVAFLHEHGICHRYA